MKKRNVVMCESGMLTTDSTATLLLRTQGTNYLVVDAFNQCFQVALARQSDLSLNPVPELVEGQPLILNPQPSTLNLPLWSCFDSVRKLNWMFVDLEGVTNLSSLFDYYDKLLFLHGDNCWDDLMQLYNILSNRPIQPDAADILGLHRYQLLIHLRSFVEKADYYDSRGALDPDTFVTLRSFTGYHTSVLDGVTKSCNKDLRAFNDLLLDYLAAIEELLL